VIRIIGKRNVIVLLISLFCLLSCGLEDIPYLDFIPDSTMTDNTSARILLPSSSFEGYSSVSYFTHFEIFYRIYISSHPESGIINTSALRSQINSSLNSDFQGLYYLTDKTSTSANPSNLDTVFNNRNYFRLTLEGADIDTVLGNGSLGKTLEISFSGPNGVRPVLILNGASYTLQRAVEGPRFSFTPQPNRNFLNHEDLYNNANVINEINADVAVPNPNTPPTPRYTYTSMYIFAIGKDYLSTIYSQPTHINIFRLPEAF